MKKRSRVLIRIKRTIITLIILAALGAVFYFGYYQFQLPADQYGVIFTKLNGWDPAVVEPSSFRIEWEGLIPLNLRMEKFVLVPVTKRISATGTLPSSEIYSMYLENNPDFSFSYVFDITYTVKPSSLPFLITEEFLRSDTYSDWLIDFEFVLTADASSLLQKKADDEEYLKKISYNYHLMEKDLLNVLAAEYDFIDFVRFTPVEVTFPDMSLYAEGKRQYFEMEKYHNDVQQSALKETSRRMIEESAKIELLEKYGALFTKYPQLINYYAIYSSDGEKLLPSIELPELEN